MPLIRFPTVKGLVYTIDLAKISDRENPRTVEAPISGQTNTSDFYVDWGDGNTEYFSLNTSTFPTHTYADGAGDIFTVVIRSATGRLPLVNFNKTQVEYTNTTFAVISVDHAAGEIGGSSLSYNFVCKSTSNLKYCDPRLVGRPSMRDAYAFFNGSGLEQDINSFCFDFLDASGPYTFDATFTYTKIYGAIPGGLLRYATEALAFNSMFTGCRNLTAIGEGLFDNCRKVTSIASTFSGCVGLTGGPYVFWNDDGTTDTDRFPNLANTTSCYTNCAGLGLSRIPTAYGGTMTVG